ncbi:MAG: 2TM domain-containing protein [Bacteroidia bacterium]|jgi:hypothetical protein
MKEYFNEQEAYIRAKKKAKEIRGFYYNLTCYCTVITGLIIINLVYTPEHLWFIYSALGWGIGLLFHGMSAFGVTPMLGKDWEERKMREYMQKEQQFDNEIKQNYHSHEN